MMGRSSIFILSLSRRLWHLRAYKAIGLVAKTGMVKTTTMGSQPRSLATVWLYVRFGLSYRDVEELRARGDA
jgi:hypothetical protein